MVTSSKVVSHLYHPFRRFQHSSNNNSKSPMSLVVTSWVLKHNLIVSCLHHPGLLLLNLPGWVVWVDSAEA